ncbi:MAG: endonuclease/exonuclease/phosphatase family protein [Myxococcota bacterium]
MAAQSKPLLYILLGWQVIALAAWGLGPAFWLFDLPNHVIIGTLGLAGVGVAGALATRETAMVVGFAASLLVHGARWWPSPPVSSRTASVRILMANVWARNHDPTPFLSLVRRQDPDVVAVLELTSGWRSALGSLRERYPYHLEVPRSDPFGMGLYSRLPLIGLRNDPLSTADLPSLVGTLPHGGVIRVVHPMPPLSLRMARDRDAHLVAVAQRLEQPGAIVVGDLNCTPWSNHFPSPQQGWPEGTWPAGLPAPFRLPLDHALTGPGLVVVERQTLPSIGSDHRPILIGVAQPEPP